MSRPDLSVVIPVYNRGALVRHTLASVRAASDGLRVETVAVDDGSTVPLSEDLARMGIAVDRLVRQENCGLLFARLAGLEAAGGRHVLFLDSDDLVSAEKLRAHVAALDAGADVSYTDHAGQALADETGPVGPHDPREILPDAASVAHFFLTIQPPPHSPAFRADYLRARIAAAPFPPSALYNPVAEIWFYHVCAPYPGRAVKCPGLALIGRHPGPRLTNQWEKLAVASLAVQEAFARTAPADTPESRDAHARFAAKAFDSWRRLPTGFSAEFRERQLALFRRSPAAPPLHELGGKTFRKAATLLGPVAAGRLFRLRNGPYSACRTLADAALVALLARLPSP
ncbi:MAG: glycosyltransferase family 2 protein [Opitutaceae bacterium]|jgi:hypothetical protein|nr:glycosyltransferase family 2 protein [Opitutaceae bacterium]